MKRTARILITGLAMLSLSTVAAACGDDDDDGDDAEPAVTRPATQASPVDGEADPTATAGDEGDAADPTAAADGAITVTATEFSFTPATFEATAGEPVTVLLENAGSAPHTLTVYADAQYTQPVDGADTGTVSGGGQGEFEVTFDTAGERFFRCEVHPAQMQGTITVQ
jgi:plastocyanin